MRPRGKVSGLPINPILIVDDFEPDAKLLELALSRAGLVNPVFFAETGQMCIMYLGGQGKYGDRILFPLPGILMLDLRMPDISGFDVLEWCHAQQHLSDLFIVVLSGFHELRDLNRAYRLGAKTFLSKPVSAADISEVVRTYPGPWQVSARPRGI